ncbi:MAG: NADP-dependent phosphogluconate dehydrogenase [Chloroflexi bacterium]|nr:NADP-dependent phosphogluconate dehydrogenase [Chloroflexota bacterium]
MAQQAGLIGLAVMGANLALNIASRGFQVVVYNRTAERTRQFLTGPASGTSIIGAETLSGFVAKLERPRRIILMVQAGAPVDSMLSQLTPLLEPGDAIMDGGNSFYQDTERRSKELAQKSLRYIGTGISGGEEGALHGPSIMPGGDRAAYDELFAPILTRIAAQVEDGPCCTYIGPGGAGHYVKMVHNGIEYGDMQLIAEAYALLSGGFGLSARELSDIFADWNTGILESYLIEITAKVLGYTDPDTGLPLVDLILDAAGQKGTGRWTSQDALQLGVPIPTIDAAVWSRNISALKTERIAAAKMLGTTRKEPLGRDEQIIGAVRDALYAAKVASYAQGMALLAAASKEYGFELNLSDLARIWKGGCIIRARLLNEIQRAFRSQPGLVNLLLDEEFRNQLLERERAWRTTVQLAAERGIPCPALSASLAYFDSYRSVRLSANLIQGQRDFFGAHTYQRTDKPGTFHTQWEG